MDLIKEPMYIGGKACWLNHLDAVLEKYDNRGTQQHVGHLLKLVMTNQNTV